MDTTDEKAIAWSAEAEIKSIDISRRDGVTGSTGENVGSQQERNVGADSSEPSIFSPGTNVTGGMLDHLIDDHLDQMAAKDDEAKRLELEAKRVKADLERLRIRVQELKALREDLKKQSVQPE